MSSVDARWKWAAAGSGLSPGTAFSGSSKKTQPTQHDPRTHLLATAEAALALKTARAGLGVPSL
jgi:hypothetical protein